MTVKPILQISGVKKSFGALVVSDNITMDIMEGEIHAVIGPNGAGKTTLVAQICGQLQPDAGAIFLDGSDITLLSEDKRALLGLVRSFQITSIFPDFTALENVALAVQLRAGHSFRFLADADQDKSLTEPALEYLKTVGLDEFVNRPAHTLAHGQQKQLELAMILALKPRMLVLDEPMAGMGQNESAGVVDLLNQIKGKVTMLLVEHDMDAVFALADRISVLVYGKIIATGLPDEIRNNRDVQAAYLGSESAADA